MAYFSHNDLQPTKFRRAALGASHVLRVHCLTPPHFPCYRHMFASSMRPAQVGANLFASRQHAALVMEKFHACH
jgi:hypothetical protein